MNTAAECTGFPVANSSELRVRFRFSSETHFPWTTLIFAVLTWWLAVTASAQAQGVLTNGWTHTGTISPTGDSDSWTFDANVGDAIVIRVEEITQTNNFAPRIRLITPNAVQQQTSSSTVAAEVAVTATNSGAFTVIVEDNVGTLATGTYRITLAKTGDPVVVSPGDEGGPMTNGVMHTGTIDVGDLDVWTVSATVGQAIVVRMGETNDVLFSPQLRIYSPGGTLLDSSYSTVGAEVVATANTDGTYLVVAGDFTGNWQGSGPYRLTLAKTGDPVVVSPGDEGGPMTGAGIYHGTIAVGDLDVLSFTACAGDSIVLKMDEAVALSSLTPQLRLYGRDGTLLNTTYNAATAQISRNAPASGAYLVVAGDFTSSWSGSGDYVLTVNGLTDGFKLCTPVITGPSINLRAVGGVAGADGVLFTHTNVAVPTSLWTPIRTNQFDAFGVWTYTNLFSPSEPQRYFILQAP